MIFGIFAIRDAKTGFLAPMVEANDQVAIRNFVHACRNTESLFFTHASDYDLYKIGNYDSETGVISAEQLTPIYSATSVYKEV